MILELMLAGVLSGAVPNYESCIVRDARGRIARSTAARQAFIAANPCPAGPQHTRRCPGHIVDHIQPLKRCGADAPHNMQWQTLDAARIKDRLE